MFKKSIERDNYTLSWVKKEKLSKDRSCYNIVSDLQSDKKQYGGTSCDHWNVGIVLGVEISTSLSFWMHISVAFEYDQNIR